MSFSTAQSYTPPDAANSTKAPAETSGKRVMSRGVSALLRPTEKRTPSLEVMSVLPAPQATCCRHAKGVSYQHVILSLFNPVQPKLEGGSATFKQFTYNSLLSIKADFQRSDAGFLAEQVGPKLQLRPSAPAPDIAHECYCTHMVQAACNKDCFSIKWNMRLWCFDCGCRACRFTSAPAVDLRDKWQFVAQHKATVNSTSRVASSGKEWACMKKASLLGA